MTVRHLLVSLALTACLLPAHAQQSKPAASQPPHNAAVEYWRAGYLAVTHTSGREEGLSALSGIDWSEIGSNLDPERMPDSYRKAREYISQEALADFVHASKRPHCDFYVPLENGPMTLMPHLPSMRSLVRAARFDAREKLIAGDADAAAQRLAAIIRAADHISPEALMISSLVSMAMVNSALDELKTLQGSGKLTAKGRDEILAALESMNSSDPYNLLGAIDGERRVMLDWLRRTYTGRNAGVDFVREAAPMLGESPDAPMLKAVSLMDEQAFRTAVDQASQYYDELISAWKSDATQSRLDALEVQLKTGRFGHIAPIMVPALKKAYENDQRARKERLDAIKALQGYTPQQPPSAR